jgi:hypothetical protein
MTIEARKWYLEGYEQGKKDLLKVYQSIVNRHRSLDSKNCHPDCFCWEVDIANMKLEKELGDEK